MPYSDIKGYSGFLWLYDMAIEEARDGAVFVEIGVALGHSIAYLAERVARSGKQIEIWAVDPWGGYARNGEQQDELGDKKAGDFSLFLRSMARHAPDELDAIRVVRATSAQACRLFKPESIDLVLIDAAHDFDSVRDDIGYWQHRVKAGGILAGDDHEEHYPGVGKACVQAFGEGGYEVKGSTWWKRLP
jgi:predicted O-methyltransferase YrrM